MASLMYKVVVNLRGWSNYYGLVTALWNRRNKRRVYCQENSWQFVWQSWKFRKYYRTCTLARPCIVFQKSFVLLRWDQSENGLVGKVCHLFSYSRRCYWCKLRMLRKIWYAERIRSLTFAGWFIYKSIIFLRLKDMNVSIRCRFCDAFLVSIAMFKL